MARPKAPTLDLSNIVATGDGKWRVDFVRSLPSGLRFRRTTVRKDQADAIAFRDDAKAEYEKAKEDESVVATNGYTLNEWFDYCLDTVLPTTASRRGKPYTSKTIQEYRTVIDKKARPLVGTIYLTKFGVTEARKIIAAGESEPMRLNIKKALSVVMEIAEQEKRRPLGSNPCRSIRIGVTKTKRTDERTVAKIMGTEVAESGQTRKVINSTPVPAGLIVEKIRVLTFDEESALLNHVRNHPKHSNYETLLLLGLRLGLRIGEALGLDRAAVDFEANTVTIDQQASRVKGVGVTVGNVKTDAGNRVIPMPRSLAEHLKVVKLLSDSPHVVHNRKGERRDPHRVSNRLRELMDGCGLGDKVVGRRFLERPTFHDLRRTCLTRLATGFVAPGVTVTPVPPTVLIRISGHEDVNTLLSYYTNADDGMVAAAMSAMP